LDAGKEHVTFLGSGQAVSGMHLVIRHDKIDGKRKAMRIRTTVFNVENAALRYHADISTAHKLLEEARQEFGDDDMMAELHAIRAIRRTAQKSLKKAS
jgi:hypothetical protein